MRPGYTEFGLKLVSLEDNRSLHPKKPHMVEEKRDKGAKYPIKLLLAESLTQYRNEMFDKFSQILQ
jgi:hypothetical protein